MATTTGKRRRAVERPAETSIAPLITVGLPVYNGAPTIGATIESVLAQTVTDFELIISDNASTDSTAAICEEYASRDKRIRLIRNPKNIGGADNYNQLVGMATGRYFNWIPADDVILPRFLDACIAALEANPKAALAYTRAAMIDAEGNRIHEYEGAVLDNVWSESVVQRYRRFMREIARNYSITCQITSTAWCGRRLSRRPTCSADSSARTITSSPS
jgi:glycosyltransferase involved in cell wall biosynthesis